MEMHMSRPELKGFARAYVAAMQESEKVVVEALFDNCPLPGSNAFEHWKVAVLQTFADISRNVISEILDHYDKAENNPQ